MDYYVVRAQAEIIKGDRASFGLSAWQPLSTGDAEMKAALTSSTRLLRPMSPTENVCGDVFASGKSSVKKAEFCSREGLTYTEQR